MNKWYRWTIIAAFLAVLIVAIGTCQASRHALDDLDNLEPENVLEAGLTLKNVTLEQPGDNGQLLWKVKAKEVTYSPDQKFATVKQPDGEFYQNGRVIYRVTAERGEVEQDGEVLFLYENIVAIAVETQLTLKGNELEWRPAEDLLLVRNNIDGTHPQLKAIAEEARLFNTDKRLELEGGVTATTTQEPWMGLQAETLTWHLAEERLETEAALTLEQFKAKDDTTVTDRLVGNSGEFKLDEQIATLKGAVKLDLLELPLKATSEIAVWVLDKETITVDQPIRIEQPKQQLLATANQGRLELEKQIIYLMGNVQATSQKNNALLTADQLIWKLDSQDVEAVGNVNYRQNNPDTTLRGDRAVGNLDTQIVTVTGKDVVTEIVPE
jgi:LPS export ABC transporter protein LptC